MTEMYVMKAGLVELGACHESEGAMFAETGNTPNQLTATNQFFVQT